MGKKKTQAKTNGGTRAKGRGKTQARDAGKTRAGTKLTRAKKPAREGRSILQRMESGVWGLGIVVLGSLLLLALVSYVVNRLDGGLPDGENLIGPVGAHLALHVFTLLGAAGLLLALATVGFGSLLIAQRLVDLRREHLLGISVIIVPVAILLHFLTPAQTTLPQGWGGIIGTALGEWVLARLIGTAGTWLLCLGAIVAGLSIIFRVHVKSFFLVPYTLLKRFIAMLLSRPEKAEETEASELTEGAEEAGTEGPLSNPRVVRSEGGSTNVARPAVADSTPAPPPAEEGAATNAGPADEPAVEESAGGTPTGLEKPAEESPQRQIQHRRELPSEEEFEGEGKDEDSSNDGNIPSARVVRQKAKRVYELPDLSLLDYHAPSGHKVDDAQLHDAARKLEEKLEDFKIDGTVGDIHPGPVIAMYEFKPGRGVKLSTISNLSKDIAMALAAEQVRIVAPIPGRDVVGFEIPNKVREMVYLREALSHSSYKQGKQRLPLVLGKDIAGNPAVTDLTRMPHLLVAGTTGSGKSVAVHSFIMSIIYRHTPDQVKFMFVDPKMLELTAYSEIPHLLWPVVTEARDAAVALRWAVSEMERRNRLMSQAGVPNISEYNQLVRKGKISAKTRATLTKRPGGGGEQVLEADVDEPQEIPYIVLVIDELADLMMVAGKQVESSIARLAQMARAAGIHMIIATQNPTIKVVTGIIKANMPCRISFKVRTMQDSRVILDQNGADDLLGYGDMLFLGPGTSKLKRIHGAFVSTEERNRVVEYLRTLGEPEYNTDIMKAMQEGDSDDGGGADDVRSSKDDLYNQAITIAVSRGKISTSALQRELGIGYNKAAVLMSKMEKEGIVGPPEAAGKPRVVLRSR